MSQPAYIDRYAEAPPSVTGPLNGTRIAVKDLLLTADGHATTAGSQILHRANPFHSPYEATVVAKLREAGAIITGKTDLDEFAMGSSTETSSFGGSASAHPVANPWDAARVPGGSSGGSAVAVATGDAAAAIGTDTGGSIRQPAAFCGVVGIKPTYGRVSRYGVTALASSLDQVGVFARDVRTAAGVLREIAGVDPHDATSVDRPVPDYAAGLTGDVTGLRVGLPKEYFVKGLEPAVEAATRAAAAELEQRGAILVDVSLPHTKYAIAAYYIIQPAEASSNLARYDGIRYGYSAELDQPEAVKDLREVYFATRSTGFGAEVKRRIMLGTYVLSAGHVDAYYKKAMQVRTLIKRDFDRAFAVCDVLLTPTTPTTAFRRGEKTDDPLEMYLNDILTVSANLAGIPGISVPAGFDASGLPIGIQLLGPDWEEGRILNAALAYEQQHDWHTKKPKEVPNG